MGLIISRFRTKETTKEILDKLQKEIIFLEKAKLNTEQSKRKLGFCFVYFYIAYAACAVFAFKYYSPTTLEDYLVALLPFIGLILIILFMKYLFNQIFQWKLKRNEKRMVDLTEKKHKTLEEVKEKETYKVAKEILETYASESLSPISRITKSQERLDTSSLNASIYKTPGTEVRRRLNTPSTNLVSQKPIAISNVRYLSNVKSNQDSNKLVPFSTPVLPKPMRQPQQQQQLKLYDRQPDITVSSPAPPGPPMPRPVLPRERGVFDKFIDYLVADGPSNRYALICRQCESHNGMALKDEFEYLAYRCVYCYYWNPARKQRPSAPKIAEGSNLRPLKELMDKSFNKSVEKLNLTAISDSESERLTDTDEKEKIILGSDTVARTPSIPLEHDEIIQSSDSKEDNADSQGKASEKHNEEKPEKSDQHTEADESDDALASDDNK